MIWLLPLLVAPQILGLGSSWAASPADEPPSGDADELRAELVAREEDLLRTDARIAQDGATHAARGGPGRVPGPGGVPLPSA